MTLALAFAYEALASEAVDAERCCGERAGAPAADAGAAVSCITRGIREAGTTTFAGSDSAQVPSAGDEAACDCRK